MNPFVHQPRRAPRSPRGRCAPGCPRQKVRGTRISGAPGVYKSGLVKLLRRAIPPSGIRKVPCAACVPERTDHVGGIPRTERALALQSLADEAATGNQTQKTVVQPPPKKSRVGGPLWLPHHERATLPGLESSVRGCFWCYEASLPSSESFAASSSCIRNPRAICPGRVHVGLFPFVSTGKLDPGRCPLEPLDPPRVDTSAPFERLSV